MGRVPLNPSGNTRPTFAWERITDPRCDRPGGPTSSPDRSFHPGALRLARSPERPPQPRVDRVEEIVGRIIRQPDLALIVLPDQRLGRQIDRQQWRLDYRR